MIVDTTTDQVARGVLDRWAPAPPKPEPIPTPVAPAMPGLGQTPAIPSADDLRAAYAAYHPPIPTIPMDQNGPPQQMDFSGQRPAYASPVGLFDTDVPQPWDFYGNPSPFIKDAVARQPDALNGGDINRAPNDVEGVNALPRALAQQQQAEADRRQFMAGVPQPSFSDQLDQALRQAIGKNPTPTDTAYARQQLQKGQPFSEIAQELAGNAKAVSGPLTAGIEKAGELGGQAGEAAFSSPAGALLPGIGGLSPETRGKIGKFGGSQAPLILALGLAPESAGPLVDAYFTANGASNVQNIVNGYQNGQLDKKEALIAFAATAPNFLPILMKGTSVLSDFAKSPEGQSYLASKNLAGERGEMRLPGSEGGAEAGRGDTAGTPPPPETQLAANAPEASVVKPEHQELITALADILPSARERAATLTKGRARQFGSRSGAIDEALSAGKTNQEALSAGKSAMSGQILDTKTLEGVFSPERVDSYYGDVLNAERGGMITGGESIAAQNALDLLTKGSRSDGSAAAIMPHEVTAMKRIFGPEIEAVLPTTPQHMTLLQKVLAPFQVYRSFITAFDDSFGGGQGWKLIGQHPEVWWRGKVAGWKAGLSDAAGAEAAMEQLRKTSPNFVRAQNAERPLGIMTTGTGDNPAEEFLSPLTEKIPLLNRSERMFTAGGSVMRQGALDAKVKMWEKANPGKSVPDDVFQTMIDMVNEGTLWGNIKPLGDYSKAAGQTFFSIRAKSALVQYPLTLAKAIMQGKDPTLRKLAGRDLGLWVGQNLAVLTAASGISQLTGVGSVDVNPWSSNFGQIKAGPVKLDIWQGYSPIARLILQTASGKQQPYGYNQPKSISRFTPATNYLPGQLSPLGGIAYDALVRKGKNAGGDPMTSTAYWAQVLSPLGIADTVNGFREAGPAGGVGAGAASFEGLRVNAYGASAGAATANILADINKAGFEPLTDRRQQLSEARKAYIAKYGGTKEKDVAAAHYYDNSAKIKAYSAQLNRDELNFWRSHRALLKQAWEAGANVELGDTQVQQLIRGLP